MENNIVRYYNPFRYRSYFYDTETGWYYLQSRYYVPSWGRFLNADGVAYLGANGDMQSYNLFAYCSNNPILFFDPKGTMVFVSPSSSSAVELFLLWLYGDGSDQYFGNNSSLAQDFKQSSKMNGIIDDAIDTYKRTGQSFFSDDYSISGFGEFDLWMGVRGFSYEIRVSEETYSTGFWFWKKTHTQYNVDVIIRDTYDFNGKESGDGLGSLLNNIGYAAQEKGYGKSYEWCLSYSQTKGKSKTRRFYIPILIL